MKWQLRVSTLGLIQRFDHMSKPHQQHLHAACAAAIFSIGVVGLPWIATGHAQEAAAEPDFSGVWLAFASSTPGATGPQGPGLSTAGQAVVDEFYGRYSDVPDPGSFCVANGMPGVMLSIAGYPIEILQGGNRITMLAELEMQVRRIYIDGRRHPADYPTTGTGHSIGRWEAQTLIVDTVLLTEWSARPWPRSEQTRIEERIFLTKEAQIDVPASAFITQQPIDDDVLVVELTLSDPDLYAGPQRRTIYYRKIVDTATLEYDCAAELWLRELEKNRVSN